MRFNKIIHPEIVLDRRGPLETRKVYKDFFTNLKLNLKIKDNVLQGHAITCSYFRSYGGVVYHVPERFSDSLLRLEKDISTSFFPKKLNCFFSFASEKFIENGDYYVGAYVLRNEKYDNNHPFFMISFVTSKNYIYNFDYPFSFSEGLTIDQVIKNVDEYKYLQGMTLGLDRGFSELRKKLVRLVFNLSIFLNSEGADFFSLPPMINESNTKKKKYEAKHEHVNECTLPIVLLNRNFHEGRQYSIDKTIVNSFPRWQPFGEKFSKIKLIWVKSHERKFNKGEKYDGKKE